MILYDSPKYYDIAFERNTPDEVEFFITCFQKHCPIKVNNVLEVACGNGALLRTFPKHGYNITGYDINPAMVEYTNTRIIEAGYQDKAHVLQGDMRYMEFKEEFEAAIVLISSISYCLKQDDIKRHLKCINHSLKKEGLYIVEILNAFKSLENEQATLETWDAQRGDVKLTATWHIDNYDLKKKIKNITCRFVGTDGDKPFSFEEKHKLRLWYFDDFKSVTEKAGFKLIAMYTEDFKPVPLSTQTSGELGSIYYILSKQ